MLSPALVFVFLVGALMPQKAEAIFVPTNDISLNVTTSGIFGVDMEVWGKEFIIDLVAYSASQAAIDFLIKEISGRILGAANTIIKDFQAELLRLENKVGDKLGIDINVISTCFKFVQFSATVNNPGYNPNKFSAKISCSKGETSDDFLRDFSNGNWNSYKTASFKLQKNPFGTYMMTQRELSRRVAEKKDIERQEAMWGGGVRGTKNKDGTTKTPASTVQSYLNIAIESPLRRMEYADELTELASQLVSSYVTEQLNESFGSE